MIVVGTEVGPFTDVATEFFLSLNGDAQAAEGNWQVDAFDGGQVFQLGGALGKGFVFGRNEVVFEANAAIDQGGFEMEVCRVFEHVLVVGAELGYGFAVFPGDVNQLHFEVVVDAPGARVDFLLGRIFAFLQVGVIVGAAVFTGLGAEIALVLEDVGAMAIEAALSGVQVALAELVGFVMFGGPVVYFGFIEFGDGGIVLTLVAEEEPLLESGVADKIGEEFVGFDAGIEVVPVFEVGLESLAGFAWDERFTRGHPVGGGVEFGGTCLCHGRMRFQSQLDEGLYGGR